MNITGNLGILDVAAGCSFNIGLECLKKQMTPPGKKKEEDVIFQTRKREMGNKENKYAHQEYHASPGCTDQPVAELGQQECR